MVSATPRTPVEDVFAGRTLNSLRRAGILAVEELTRKTSRELLKTRGWGRKTLMDVRDGLEGLGLRLAGEGVDLRTKLAREDLVDAVAEAAKRWWPTARIKASRGRMSGAELDLFRAVSALKKIDGEDAR